jgi:hypothetical protein
MMRQPQPAASTYSEWVHASSMSIVDIKSLLQYNTLIMEYQGLNIVQVMYFSMWLSWELKYWIQ